MVRKVSRFVSVLVVALMISVCFTNGASATTYNVYDGGNLSSTYTTYFRDILGNQSILKDYVAFRSGQYTYTLAVGDLDYDSDFSGNGRVKIFTFDTGTSGYNSYTTYTVTTDSSFYLITNDNVLYSNLGDYPQLIERGANFEVFNTILLFVIICSNIIGRIFRKC